MYVDSDPVGMDVIREGRARTLCTLGRGFKTILQQNHRSRSENWQRYFDIYCTSSTNVYTLLNSFSYYPWTLLGTPSVHLISNCRSSSPLAMYRMPAEKDDIPRNYFPIFACRKTNIFFPCARRAATLNSFLHATKGTLMLWAFLRHFNQLLFSFSPTTTFGYHLYSLVERKNGPKMTSDFPSVPDVKDKERASALMDLNKFLLGMAGRTCFTHGVCGALPSPCLASVVLSWAEPLTCLLT